MNNIFFLTIIKYVFWGLVLLGILGGGEPDILGSIVKLINSFSEYLLKWEKQAN